MTRPPPIMLSDASELSQIRDVERRNRQLAAFHAVAQVGAEADVDKLAEHLARVAAEATESDTASIYLGDPARGESLVMHGVYGYDGPMLESYRVLAPESLIATAARSLVTRTISLAAMGDKALDATSEGIFEAAIVPLHTKGRLTGVLNLARKRPQPYEAEEVFGANILGDLIAIQIEKARLHAESERRVRHLSLLFELARAGSEASAVAPLVERVLAATLDAMSVDSALIHILNDGRLHLAGAKSRTENPPEQIRALLELPLDESTISGRAALRRATVTVDMAHWPSHTASIAARRGGRHAAAAPLLSGEALVGTFVVIRRSDTPFTSDEILLLETCAAHIARAVEHARLFEAERRRAQDLAVINELGALISEQLDLSAVLRAGVGHLARIADVPQTFLLLLDPDGGSLRVVASNAESAGALDVVLRRDEPSAAMTAIRERKPVVIEDTADTTVPVAPVPTRRFGHRGLIAVPMFSRGVPIGAVVLGETRKNRRFAPAAVERAVAVANQLATALGNARLFEDLRQSYQKLESAQKQLVQRERLAALGELAASVAHEVRNPLAVIFNSVATLRRRAPEGPDVHMLLDIVGEEAARLNRIVGELLDFARPAEPRLLRLPLEPVIAGAAEAATAAMGEGATRLSLEIPRTLPAVEMDPQMVRQALINLMVNALQATPAGGDVIVRAAEESTAGRAWVRIDVVDDGPGVPPALVAQVFQPFFTTKAKGTGLGLAIVRRIVEAHHGEVGFESRGGRGTTFSLRLPV